MCVRITWGASSTRLLGLAIRVLIQVVWAQAERQSAAKFTASSAKRKCRALSWGEVHLPFPQAHGPGPPLTDTLASSQGNATSTPGCAQYPDQGRREAPEKSLWYCPPGMGTVPPRPGLSTEGARGACPTPPLPVFVPRAQPGAEDNGKCKPPLITATWLLTPFPEWGEAGSWGREGGGRWPRTRAGKRWEAPRS